MKKSYILRPVAWQRGRGECPDPQPLWYGGIQQSTNAEGGNGIQRGADHGG